MTARSNSRRAALAMAAILVLILLVWAVPKLVQRDAAAQAVPRPVAPRGALMPGEQATIELFEKSRLSVVHITTQTQVVDVWTRNMFNIPRGSGSGFVWDDEGHIVTNYHVIEGASAALVRLSDGRDAPGSLVGASPAHDLAVLKIDVPNPPPAILIGSSSDLKVGQAALAIGNPFGLDWSLTTGIVSALDRALPTERGRALIDDLVQTDAAVNPGNSGGPLLDSAGRLIGVNTAIFSPSGASAGVGFAVPVDTVNRVVPQLIATGEYVRPALGITVDEQSNQLITRRLGMKGVAVLEVAPGSGAAAAGLQGIRVQSDGSIIPGDIIVAVDGEPVDSVARLLSRLDQYRVGDTVQLTVLRDGNEIQLKVMLQGGSQ